MRKFLTDLLARLLPPQPEAALVERTFALVEEVLDTLGVGELQDPEWTEENDEEEGFAWSLQVGSAPIEVGLFRNEVLAEFTLEVRSAILRLPPTNLLAFYRRLLELNRLVVGCSIGVENDVVLVAAERRLPGLGKAEFVEMLLNVASAADQFDDELAQEFGAERVGAEEEEEPSSGRSGRPPLP